MRSLIPALFLLSCAPLTGDRICGLVPAGGTERWSTGWVTYELLDNILPFVFESFKSTKDPRLNDPSRFCRALSGTVFKSTAHPYFDSWGRKVTGVSVCWNWYALVATPESGRWQDSSLVHELAHVGQACAARLPTEDLRDVDHSNWDTDGIEGAIVEANSWKP